MKKLLTIFTVLLSTVAFAQTGPGGVGKIDGSSSLTLWLRAHDINQISNTGVSTWKDASGYNNDAAALTTNEPVYVDNVLNGYPVISFSASGVQYMKVPHNAVFNSDFVTVFVVGKMNEASNSKGTFVVKTSGNNLTDGFGLIRLNSKEKLRFFAGDYGVNRDSEHFHYGLTDLYVGNFRSGTSNNKVTAMVNNAGSSTSVTGVGIPSSNDMYIGARPGNSGMKSFLDGEIAEVIVLSNDLPSVDRILVANYLSAKYGFAISNSKYSYFYSHPHGVIGIGRYADVTHSASKSEILEIKESSTLVNGNFLMIGHDGKRLKTSTGGLPMGYSQRLRRSWRAHVNGLISGSKLVFHMDGLDHPTDVNDYALLLDLDGDGDYSNATVIPASDYNDTKAKVKFNNIHLHTGAVFTLVMYKSIIWENGAFTGGSGVNQEPNSLDEGRAFWVLSPNCLLSESANVYSMNISPSCDLSIDDNVCLSVGKFIWNRGSVTLEENASLIQESKGRDYNNGNGTYTVKRTGLNSNHGYNNWSSPMKTQDLETAFPYVNPCDLYTYSGVVQNWKYDFPTGYSTTCLGNPVTFNANQSIAGGDGNMDIGRGYFITGNTINPQKEFVGKVNNGDITIPVYATNLGNNPNWNDDDWNFVGNPYPSALNPWAFWQENVIDNQKLTDALYFWDDAATPGAAYDQYNDYASWNLTGGIASDNSSKIISALNHIASAQGFMVWADSNGVLDGTVLVDSIKFTNSMRSCLNEQFYKTEEDNKELTWVMVTTPSGEKSKFLIGTVPGATNGQDRSYDARRVSSNAHVEISTMVGLDTTSYVIQGIQPLSPATLNQIVPVKVVSDEDGTHVFSRAAYVKNGAPLKVYLRDNALNITHDFENGDYQATLAANTRYFTRFELVFVYSPENENASASKDINTSIEDLDQAFTLRAIDNGFVLTSTEGIEGTLEVYDLAGRMIYQEDLVNKVYEKTVSLAQSSGMYIIKVIDDQNEIHTKKTMVY